MSVNTHKFYVIGIQDDSWEFFGGDDTLMEAKATAWKNSWEEDGKTCYPKIYAARDCEDIGSYGSPCYRPCSDEVVPAAFYDASEERWVEPCGVLLARAIASLGIRRHGNEGHMDVEFREDGGAVIVAKVNLATMEPIEEPKLFGDFDAALFLREAYKLLGPCRRPECPDLKRVFARVGEEKRGCGVDNLHKTDCPLFEYCTRNCDGCQFRCWMLEGLNDGD